MPQTLLTTSYLALVAGGGLSLIQGIILLRRRWQRRMDQERLTYRVTFPRELKFERAALLFTSLSGINTRYYNRVLPSLSPKRTIACEILATGGPRVEWLISFPKDLQLSVESSLQGTIPGIGYEEVEPYHHQLPWIRGCELSATLASFEPDPYLIESLLRSLTTAQRDEAILVQLIVEPTGDLILIGEEDEAEEATLFAMVRLAARAHPIRAEELLKNVLAKYKSLHVFSFRELTADVPVVKTRRRTGPLTLVNDQATPHAWPGAVTSQAAAVAWAVPFGNPGVLGVKLGGSRQLPPDDVVPKVGFVIGASTASGHTRPVALNPKDINTHIDLTGKTGTGKSVLMGLLMIQQMLAGDGVGLIDPHGDLVNWVLARIPKHRLDDVVVVEPARSDSAVAFNIFEGPESPEAMADQINAIFRGIYKDTTGVFNENYLAGAIQALASVPGMTLVDVPHFLTDRDFRTWIMDQVDDLNLSHQWKKFEGLNPKQQESAVAPGLHRVQPLLRRSSMRLMLGQSANALDMRTCIKEKKIILISLPTALGPGAAEFIGSAFFNHLWSSALSIPAADRVPFGLHMDEAQKFMQSGYALDAMLDEARKFLLRFILAHPSVTGLPMPMRTAINRSTRTKISFQLAAEDAGPMAREFGEPVIATDLTMLGKREFILKTVSNEQTSAPVAVRSLDAPPEINDPEQVRALSRQRWNRPAKEIDTEIMKRQQGADSARREGWEECNGRLGRR
jgi:Helicase HerA, central domain